MQKQIIISLALVILVSWSAKMIENFSLQHQKTNSSKITQVAIKNSPQSKEVVKNDMLTKSSSSTVPIKKPIQKISTNPLEQNLIIRQDGDKEKQKVVDYLWKKSHNIDLILTFERESGLRKNAVNYNRDKKGNILSSDIGFCQLNNQYHKQFLESEDFKDTYKQLDYCMEVYKNAISRGIIRTTFFAYNVRNTVRNRFTIKPEAYKIYIAALK